MTDRDIVLYVYQRLRRGEIHSTKLRGVVEEFVEHGDLISHPTVTEIRRVLPHKQQPWFHRERPANESQ